MFIQEDGELYQGDLKLTGDGDFWGGARGYQGALELTDDFGILIRVNSPAPVTLERSERISSCFNTLLNPPVPVTLGI